MTDSSKSRLKAKILRRLERAGLLDRSYQFHTAILAIIYTGFWLLVLTGMALWLGYRSNTAQWILMLLAAVFGITSALWVVLNRKH